MAIGIFNCRLHFKEPMPRQAKLRKKEIGKATDGFTYFGNADAVPVSEAAKPLQRPYQNFIREHERQQDTPQTAYCMRGSGGSFSVAWRINQRA